MVAYIGEIEKKYHKKGDAFFTAWIIKREYKREELCQSELLYVQIGKVFEPAGEECGTLYDESNACIRCGVGRTQMNALTLDLKQIKMHVDIAKTIAGEVIVSSQFKQAWEDAKLSGAVFSDVYQKGRKPTLVDTWYQLQIDSQPLEIISPTIAGTDPFNFEDAERYVCDKHVLGLNLISEITVSRNSWNSGDMLTTKQAFGWKQGLLMPERPLILSQNAWDCLCNAEIKGYSVEVVHMK